MSRLALAMLFAIIALPGSGVGAQQPRAASSPVRRLTDFKDIDELRLEDLLEATVSIAAGRVQRIEEAPSVVSVVTDEDIRRMGAQTLDQVLRTLPGFDVLRDHRGQSAIVVRGVGAGAVSENVLVLFNGHRLNEQMFGSATTVSRRIPLAGIKQIEVIRGPGSALFGANAFVGVVNLVPYTPQTFDGVEVTTHGGSFGTAGASVLGARALGALGVVTTLEYSTTAGPRLPVEADLQTVTDRAVGARLGLPPASLAPTRTRDAYRAADASLSLSYRGFQLDTRVHDGQEEGGYIGFFQAFGRYNRFPERQYLVAGTQRLDLGSRMRLTTRLGFTRNEIGGFLNPLPPGYTRVFPDGRTITFAEGIRINYEMKSRRYDADVRLDIKLAESNQLILGVGSERESTFNPNTEGNFDIATGGELPALRRQPFDLLPQSSRTIHFGFIQDTWNVVPAVGITAGVRHERYSDFGSTTNPRVALVWRLSRDAHLKVLHGRAFRAPTFTELQYLVPGTFAGNPFLQPSTIATSEIALGYRRANLRVSGNVFANDIRDFIGASRATNAQTIVGSGSTFLNNRAGLRVRGLELEARRSFGLDNDLFANYTYQHAIDRSAIGGGRIADVPAHLAAAGATTALGRFVSVTPTVVWRGERPRDPADYRLAPGAAQLIGFEPRRSVPAYAVVNLNVRLRNIFDTFEFTAGATNLLDVRYVDPSGFNGVPGDLPAAGRAATLRASYKF